MAKAVETLFNIQTPEQVRQSQQKKDLEEGKLLTERPGTAGLLFAPQRSRAIGQGVAGLFGAETRSQAEIDAEQNRELLTGIYQRAQQSYPTNRTAQLNMIAMELAKAGKINEAQKARAMAQQSALTEAQIGKETALGAKATAQASESEAKMAAVGLGDVKPEDFTPDSWQAYINSGDSLSDRNASLLKTKLGDDLTSYQKILKQAYPNDPTKQQELAQQYAKNYAATAGGDVNPDKVYAELVLDINKEAIQPYRSASQEADMTADQIDSLITLTDTAVTGALSDTKQFLISLGRQAGFSEVSLKSLTNSQLIARVLNEEVLKRAGNLKGALSDKDLAFLKNSVGDLTNTPQAIRAALMDLKNKKLRAKYVNDKFNETIKTNKQSLTSEVLDIDGWASEATGQLGLINPQLVAANFMMSDGQPDPQIVADIKAGLLTVDDVVSPDDSDMALQALLDALQ